MKKIEQAANEHTSGGWTDDKIVSFKAGVEFAQRCFTKDEIINILEKRNKEAFSLQKYEYEQLSKAIIAIKNLVPPDCFILE